MPAPHQAGQAPPIASPTARDWRHREKSLRQTSGLARQATRRANGPRLPDAEGRRRSSTDKGIGSKRNPPVARAEIALNSIRERREQIQRRALQATDSRTPL